LTVLSIDFETYGTVELKRSGVYPYAQHHDTGIWCMGWAFDDEDPQLWQPEDGPLPPRVVDHVRAGGEIRAWNASFERVMWALCAVRRYGFPVVRADQFVCTMAEAQAMALPRSLDQASEVLRLAVKKDREGKALSLRMCRPRRFDDDTGTPIWWDEAPKRVRLGDYCMQDVRTERGIAAMVRRLNARERAIYLETQAMNDRGITLDVELVMAAQQVALMEIDKQNALLAEATDGAVTEVTKVAKLKEWLVTQGIANEEGGAVDSLDKAALRELLSGSANLTAPALVALQARQEAARSSVKKLDAMTDCLARDGRCHGLILYHAASTGRDSGQLMQPQNFPRGNDVKKPEQYIQRVLDLEMTPLNIISAMLRSMLTARPGHELLCSDFASIEARVLAWLAGQDDLVAAFAADAPIYKMMAAKVYRCEVGDIVKPSDRYTLGKSLILGCGYQMGAKKFIASSKEQYGLVVEEELAEAAVQTYRNANARIVSYWGAANKAALDAVEHPGEVFLLRDRVKFVKRNSYLWITLPARRSLAYANPKIVQRPVPWDKTGKETKAAVEFSGINSYTRKWERQALYGGSITENIVQAVARDLLMDAALRASDAGYPSVLRVHDELVSERAIGEGSLDEFTNLMKTVPEWAQGCPISCESWRGVRYRK
jgi:DNA polymerase